MNILTIATALLFVGCGGDDSPTPSGGGGGNEPAKPQTEVTTVRADLSLTPEELDEFCKQSPDIANFKRPRYYRFTEQIPFNATGKKLHVKIKETAEADLKNGLLYRL